MEFTREPRENQGKINERALNFRVGGGLGIWRVQGKIKDGVSRRTGQPYCQREQ